MKKQQFAYCGLICETCPLMIARATDDIELKKKTLEEWTKLYAGYLGRVTLKPEDMACTGCRAERGVFIGCSTCVIRKCCSEKKFTTCAECNEYGMCEILNGFYSVPENRHAKVNLDNIRSGL